MNYLRVPILALFLSTGCILDASADSRFLVAAQETQAAVTPRASYLRRIALPALRFNFLVQIQCPGPAESLTLSIADTLVTLDREDIEYSLSAEVSLNIPAQQLTLAASDSFCLEENPAAQDELVVPGFATAHASLRCAGREGPSVRFASTPLTVRLKCDREPVETQELSPDK